MGEVAFMHDRDLFNARRENTHWPAVVIGWFTPDYRELASRFSVNLDHYELPYHLIAQPLRESWDTSLKPAIVLRAMEMYPNKSIVLMDVDCKITGDISQII